MNRNPIHKIHNPNKNRKAKNENRKWKNCNRIFLKRQRKAEEVEATKLL